MIGERRIGDFKTIAFGRVITNLSHSHFRGGVKFRDEVVRIEDTSLNEPFGDFFLDIGTYCSACVLACVAALEANINEMFIEHGGRLRNVLPKFDVEFWGTPSLTVFEI